MKNKLFAPFRDLTYWIDLFAMYFMSSITTLLGVPWYTSAIFALITIVIITVIILKWKNSKNENDILGKKMQAIIKKAKKSGDVSLTSVKNNKIWASTCFEFNDPFECQYLYLNEDDLLQMGIPNPENAKKIWDSIMGQIRQRITTICFTQNPNDMPMWAHYANEHKGFCVEYEVKNYKNLYPVFYSENRMKAQTLFIDLIYSFFNKEAKGENLSTLFKYIILTSAFKDKSWESEHEIRAIFMNSLNDMTPTGKLFDCKTIGIHPTKIYIGAKCRSDHIEELVEIANELNITYEKCMLSCDENYRVIAEQHIPE